MTPLRPDLPSNFIRAYLQSTGWSIANHRPLHEPSSGERLFAKRWGAPRTFDLFVSSDPSQVELVVPRDERSADYQRRVQDTLRTLEEVEERPSQSIATEILFINFDLIKSALSNSYLVYDAIPLDSAIDHVGRMRDLLSSSATTEISPRPFYGRVRKAAVEYSSRCLFGHTYQGSFGFTVQSPLTTEEFQQSLFGPTIPFERKVLVRLVNGLDSVKAAQKENNLELAMDPETGLSANGFDILADIVENAGGQVSLEVAFSRRWQPKPDSPRVETFEFSQQTVEVSREAAEKLRATYQPVEKTIVGRIINLRNTTDPSQLMPTADSREVVIDFEDEDLGEIKVRIALNAADYLKAVEAHKLGQRLAVDGLLERHGLRYIIRNSLQVRVF
ncbi:MAG: hypothetical protein JWM43_3384 [Acidobacteriaceae bacterium]|nr:hypothetical protein [Acidobacteriaceae bacterium]